MEKIPVLLKERISNCYSTKEVKALGHTFSLEKRSVSFRVNTLKSNSQEISNFLADTNIEYTELPFPEGSFILDKKHTESDLWKQDIYKDGHIYIQSLSSQIPVQSFTINAPLTILDACAAPGGKTSQLSAFYPNAQIYAFEPSKIRYEKMCHNLKKLGCSNVTPIYDSIENIAKHIDQECFFDIVLIDAPCSNEGSLLYNNTKFLENWDISHIKKNYKRQKRICDHSLPYLKEGGELIYSTCTLAPEENEGVVHYLLCNYPELQLESIDLEDSPQITRSKPLASFGKHSYKKEVSERCVRILPSEFSEGFFVGKFIKKEET